MKLSNWPTKKEEFGKKANDAAKDATESKKTETVDGNKVNIKYKFQLDGFFAHREISEILVEIFGAKIFLDFLIESTKNNGRIEKGKLIFNDENSAKILENLKNVEKEISFILAAIFDFLEKQKNDEIKILNCCQKENQKILKLIAKFVQQFEKTEKEFTKNENYLETKNELKNENSATKSAKIISEKVAEILEIPGAENYFGAEIENLKFLHEKFLLLIFLIKKIEILEIYEKMGNERKEKLNKKQKNGGISDNQKTELNELENEIPSDIAENILEIKEIILGIWAEIQNDKKIPNVQKFLNEFKKINSSEKFMQNFWREIKKK